MFNALERYRVKGHFTLVMMECMDTTYTLLDWKHFKKLVTYADHVYYIESIIVIEN